MTYYIFKTASCSIFIQVNSCDRVYPAAMSQFQIQSTGLGPNKKLGSMYGGKWNFAELFRKFINSKTNNNCDIRTDTFSNATGMGSSPFGGPALGMGAERLSTKYGECLLSNGFMSS